MFILKVDAIENVNEISEVDRGAGLLNTESTEGAQRSQRVLELAEGVPPALSGLQTKAPLTTGRAKGERLRRVVSLAWWCDVPPAA